MDDRYLQKMRTSGGKGLGYTMLVIKWEIVESCRSVQCRGRCRVEEEE